MRIRLFAVVSLLTAAIIAAVPALAKTYPRIDIRHRTLANGLDFYSVEDHSSPTVAIEVWYRVGAKDDPDGRGGFAHLFEHLMFKATAHMTDEMLPRLVDDAGGSHNAGTMRDATEYWEVIPSNYLQTLLWAEADRMAFLKVDEATFTTEREVVKDELRRDLDGAYAPFSDLVNKNSLSGHPYARPVIGTLEELDAANVEEVQTFHRAYYRPDNAVLVVVGDFDPSQLNAWVDRYFGPIPKPVTPLAHLAAQQPRAGTGEQAFRYYADVPFPAVAMTWLVPTVRSPDADALYVLAALLDDGAAPLLRQKLILDQKIAHDVSVTARLMLQDIGSFRITLKMSGSHTTEEGVAAIRKELDALATKIDPADVQRTKLRLVNQTLRARQTNQEKAENIAISVIFWGDAWDVNRDLQRTDAVTPEDVQGAIKRYLCDKSVIVSYEREPPL